jgi:hypothetical protein
MKLIRIILTVIIISSSAFPCMDMENLCFNEEIVLHTSLEGNHPDAEDNCTPFCICACCSISFSADNYSSFSNIFNSTNSIIHYQDSYLFNPLLSIWQPPKA